MCVCVRWYGCIESTCEHVACTYACVFCVCTWGRSCYTVCANVRYDQYQMPTERHKDQWAVIMKSRPLMIISRLLMNSECHVCQWAPLSMSERMKTTFKCIHDSHTVVKSKFDSATVLVSGSLQTDLQHPSQHLLNYMGRDPGSGMKSEGRAVHCAQGKCAEAGSRAGWWWPAGACREASGHIAYKSPGQTYTQSIV